MFPPRASAITQSCPDVHTYARAKVAAVGDPRYAPAWDGMARNFSNKAKIGLLPNKEGFAQAREAAMKALAIDPDYAPAHSRLGWIAAFGNNDLAGGAQHLKRALAFDPTDLNILGNSAVLLQSSRPPRRSASARGSRRPPAIRWTRRRSLTSATTSAWPAGSTRRSLRAVPR